MFELSGLRSNSDFNDLLVDVEKGER